MKYIEFPELSRLARALSHEGPECAVRTRLEAYSCKNIKRDKKLFKSLEHAYNDEVSNSPPLPSWLAQDSEAAAEMNGTPFGPIDKHASRKTLYLLIATLNIAFPDHEFSDVRPAHFNREQSGAGVLNALSTTLVSPHRAGMRAPRTYSSYPPTSADFFPSSVPTSSSPVNTIVPSPFAPPQIVSGTHPSLYRLVDEVIGLAECEVFSYEPDIDSDPHANDLSDDDDDVASVGDEDSSTDVDEEVAFEFDDYDVDEVKKSPGCQYKAPILPASPSIPIRASAVTISARTSASLSYRHRRGALLWSSHWFFLNRKLKRILFISVWARTRGMSRSWTGDTLMGEDVATSNERFLGWEGAAGAGARAMGLRASV